MKKRVRNQLIGITALIIIGLAALFLLFDSRGASAVNMTVEEALSDAENVGQRIKVGGVVVAGSWDKKTDPMTFEIKDETDTEGKGKTLTVVYTGTVPSTFGDGVTAIVTGDLGAGNVITSGEMITKCPSKYESAAGAYEIAQFLLVTDQMTDTTVRIAGTVKAGTIVAPGGAVRFTVVDSADATKELNIAWEGALPEGMIDGSRVVITGSVDSTALFNATNVAMEQK